MDSRANKSFFWADERACVAGLTGFVWAVQQMLCANSKAECHWICDKECFSPKGQHLGLVDLSW